MRSIEDKLDERINRSLDTIRVIPPRNILKAGIGREKYIVEVKALNSAATSDQAVSESLLDRLKVWIKTSPFQLRRKERFSMVTTLSTLIIIASLVFGGVGASVYAAQDSLPTEQLYPLKTFSEDLRLRLTEQTQTQLELALAFAARRMGEIEALHTSGEAIPMEVASRLQKHLDYALKLAAGIPDNQMNQALEQIRATIQNQEQTLQRLQKTEQPDPTLEMIQEMLRARNRVCEIGLEDPLTFREQMRSGWGQSEDEHPEQPESSPSPGDQITTPEPSAGTGPNVAPGSGEGAGPGPGDGGCTDCEPVQDGSGPGPGPNAGDGSGQGQGPGSGECTNCDPVQDGTGTGPGPQAGGSSNPETPGGGGNSEGNGGKP